MCVRVEKDDIGTGYSTLSYLRRFPYEKIKNDPAYISDLRDPFAASEAPEDMTETPDMAAGNAATIVRAIVGLGQNLGISTTAEGVETVQQFAQVRQLGCREAQGYFISPPRPAREVQELLRRLDTTLPAITGSGPASQMLVA
jgi:EAL domain-containing protein (putative c-di-GMP-specific phosphodiesterase class I)